MHLVPIMQNVKNWVINQDKILCLILNGSRVHKENIDQFSDYDFAIFGNDLSSFLIQHEWLAEIGEVLIYQKEQFSFYGKEIPTRLIVLKDGSRIDLSFYDMSYITAFRSDGLPPTFDNGYEVIIDKSGLWDSLPKPSFSGYICYKPSKDTFLKAIYDFWFELIGIAKYLKRGDTLFAKSIQHQFVGSILLQMSIWYTQSISGWNLSIHSAGKRFNQWADTFIVEGNSSLFSDLSIANCWQSLFDISQFFSKIARLTSTSLEFCYPSETEQLAQKLIKKIQEEGPA